MKIQKVTIDEIKPYFRNPRNITEEAVNAVAESIKEFGFRNPIIVDKNYVIVAGHTRYKASLKLGLDKVPVIVADDLTDEQARAYRIFDNKTSEKSTWNQEFLIPELRAYTNLAKFEVYFPEFKIPNITMSHSSISQDQVNAKADDLEHRFEDVTAVREKSIKTFVCPHCGDEFDASV